METTNRRLVAMVAVMFFIIALGNSKRFTERDLCWCFINSNISLIQNKGTYDVVLEFGNTTCAQYVFHLDVETLVTHHKQRAKHDANCFMYEKTCHLNVAELIKRYNTEYHLSISCCTETCPEIRQTIYTGAPDQHTVTSSTYQQPSTITPPQPIDVAMVFAVAASLMLTAMICVVCIIVWKRRRTQSVSRTEDDIQLVTRTHLNNASSVVIISQFLPLEDTRADSILNNIIHFIESKRPKTIYPNRFDMNLHDTLMNGMNECDRVVVIATDILLDICTKQEDEIDINEKPILSMIRLTRRNEIPVFLINMSSCYSLLQSLENELRPCTISKFDLTTFTITNLKEALQNFLLQN